MIQIGIIAPDANIYALAKEAVSLKRETFYLEQGLLSEGVSKARALAAKGVNIFVSRGGTAKGIAEALPHCTVITVPITGFDLLRAWTQACRYGDHVGVVAFPAMVKGISALNETLGAEITVFPLSSEEDALNRVTEARSAGVSVVMGGFITGIAAQTIGIPGVVIESGPEAVAGAIEDALHVGRALELEKAKNVLRRAVITYVDNGIVAVDEYGRVTILNPSAAGMLHCEPKSAQGQFIDDVWPELRLGETVADGEEELGVIIRCLGRDVICNKIPLTVSGKTIGAVATCHDVAVIQKMEASVRSRALSSGHKATIHFHDILGTSAGLRRAVKTASNYARTNATVLIQGETGTGKELFAQSIHTYGARSEAPFVAVNCAALPMQLLESELFGYVGGAFTGANVKGKAGILELAHGGTVFLDEIAELELATQSKILRVLQEKQVMRLGDDHVLPIDVRIIAATNKNLRKMVEQGTFRDDLYYRLNVLLLDLPPLRNRPEDISILAQHMLMKSASIRTTPPRLSIGALKLLGEYDWPGNVRELQNVMERIAATVTTAVVSEAAMREILSHGEIAVEDHDEDIGRIKDALRQTGGRVGKAAALLGMSRATLWRKRQKIR